MYIWRGLYVQCVVRRRQSLRVYGCTVSVTYNLLELVRCGFTGGLFLRFHFFYQQYTYSLYSYNSGWLLLQLLATSVVMYTATSYVYCYQLCTYSITCSSTIMCTTSTIGCLYYVSRNMYFSTVYVYGSFFFTNFTVYCNFTVFILLVLLLLSLLPFLTRRQQPASYQQCILHVYMILNIEVIS